MESSSAMSALNAELSRLLPQTQSPAVWAFNMLHGRKDGTRDAVYAPGYPHVSNTADPAEMFDHANLNLSTCDKDEPDDNAYFQSIVYIMYISIFIFALFGNGVVCYIVYSSPRMKTVTNYFIVNLAVGDILMSLFCVPFSFFPTLLLQYWPFGSLLCHLVNYSQAISVLVSAYTLVAISIDRYIAILWPLRPRITKRHAKYIIAGVWIIALLTALPIPVVSRLSQPEQWYQQCDKYVCEEHWPLQVYNYYYTIALLVLQFVIPLLVLVFTYTRIAFAVWGKKPPGEAENSRDQRMAKSKRKMIKMMVTIVIVFTICWLPFNVLVILMHNTGLTQWEFIIYVWFIFHWLAMSHCCYNPIIYCYMNARFRIGFLQILYFVPGIRRCCCINAYTRDRAASLRTGIALTGIFITIDLLEWAEMIMWLVAIGYHRHIDFHVPSLTKSRIDESGHLHRVNTSTTFISTRRKTNI